MPDLIGALGQLFGHGFEWYLWAHQLYWWTYVLTPWALHVLMDSFVHPPENPWWTWPGVLWEIGTWLITAGFIYLAVEKRKEPTGG